MTATSSTAEWITVDKWGKPKKRDPVDGIILRFPGLSMEAYRIIQNLEKSENMVFSASEVKKTYSDGDYRCKLTVNTSPSIESQRGGWFKTYVYIRDHGISYYECMVTHVAPPTTTITVQHWVEGLTREAWDAIWMLVRDGIRITSINESIGLDDCHGMPAYLYDLDIDGPDGHFDYHWEDWPGDAKSGYV